MRTCQELRSEVTAVIAQSCYLTPEELPPDISLSELGLDSLSIAYVVTELEKTLGQKVSQDALAQLFEAERLDTLIEAIVALADHA